MNNNLDLLMLEWETALEKNQLNKAAKLAIQIKRLQDKK